MPESKKPKVLVLVMHYLPGYRAGGPIRSISNLANALEHEFEFRIVSTDRDLGDEKPFSNIPPCTWLAVGGAQVMYIPPTWRGLPAFVRALRETPADLLYINSLFARRYSILPMVLRLAGFLGNIPVLLAPRGELSVGALGLKRFRKRLFIRVSHLLGFYRRTTWHASTVYERDDIMREYPGSCVRNAGPVAVITAGDVPDSPPPGRIQTQRDTKRAGTLRAVFVSRISPKKNLLGAIRMLHGLAGRVEFTIVGPAEDREYWADCQREIAGLPPNVVVTYAGELTHESVPAMFAKHDVFLFPTLGENFGHVIVEALLAGCPILTSDQTPWRQLEARGIGFDLPLTDIAGFRSAIQRFIDMGAEQFAPWSRRAQEFAIAAIRDETTVSDNRNMLRACIAGGSHSSAARALQGVRMPGVTLHDS